MITDFCFKRGFDVCLITKLHFKKGHHLKQMSLRGWNHCTTLIVLSHQHHVCVCVCVQIRVLPEIPLQDMTTIIRTKIPVKSARFLFTWCNPVPLWQTQNDRKWQSEQNQWTSKEERRLLVWSKAVRALRIRTSAQIPVETGWLIRLWKKGGKKGNFFEIKLKCSDNFAFYRILAFNPRPNPFRKCLKLSASDRNECLPASDFSIK